MKQTDERIALWGAGNIGKKALIEIGAENVSCIIDNSVEKKGSFLCGVPIVSFEDFCNSGKRRILITTYSVDEIYSQIKDCADLEVDVYRPLFECYGDKNNLIQNQYEAYAATNDEQAWNNNLKDLGERKYINGYTKILANKKRIPMFDHVEIETINRCNGTCSFCPVSVGNDIREKKLMNSRLFYKIIDNLSDMNYAGRLCIFSNNEPFLDDRIIEFHKYTREKLPKARMHLFTNGSVLTVAKFEQIIPYLDELIIDNYNQNLEMNSRVKCIYEYCKNNETLKGKVTIAMRKQNEILTSRGGNAPNRKKTLDVSNYGCLLPFFQLIIRPSGEVSLCCNDAWGENTLGDLTFETIEQVWFGQKHLDVIKRISQGRQYIKQCSACDSYNLAPRMNK